MTGTPQVPLLGNPGNWEELEQSYASLQTWLGNLNSTVQAVSGSAALTPVGALLAYVAATAPTGWLLCNGAAVSRVTYAVLFGIIGTTYGVGDGSTTFNLPDLRQRFALGKAAAGTGSTLGSTGGAVDHTHTAGAITMGGNSGATAPATDSQGAHTHTVNSHTHGAGSYQINAFQTGVTAGTGAAGALDNSIANAVNGTSGATAPGTDSQGAHTHTVASHTHTGASLTASGAASGTNNPPFQVFNYIIYAGV